jgi:murein DD-endopeptidase MepM/ murein hydrolase activator NlpD
MVRLLQRSLTRILRSLGPSLGVAACVVAVALPLTGLAQPARPQPLSQLSIVFPLLSPRISSNYGTRIHPKFRVQRHHNGLDFAVPESTHVRAVTAGRVVFAGPYGGYGKLVTIQHDKDTVSLYGHLSEIRVEVGQQVTAGGIIGRVGKTGVATGPHLHFEWRKGGKPVDPLEIFPQILNQADG